MQELKCNIYFSKSPKQQCNTMQPRMYLDETAVFQKLVDILIKIFISYLLRSFTKCFLSLIILCNLCTEKWKSDDWRPAGLGEMGWGLLGPTEGAQKLLGICNVWWLTVGTWQAATMDTPVASLDCPQGAGLYVYSGLW